MSSYELIKDLEKKLGLYRNSHEHRIVPPNHIHEIVAKYICAAGIYPNSLNRQTVVALIEDRTPWPSNDGGEYCLAYAVSIDELEDARVISFPNGDLSVQRTVHVTPEMPRKLRHQLDAHHFLYDIKYRSSDLLSPQLRISKNKVTPSDIPLLEKYLQPNGDFFHLSIDHDDIVGVGTHLWKRLRSQTFTLDFAFAEYAKKMRLASDRAYVFEIDFDHDIDTQEYLECAYNYIAADESLFQSWEDCAADVAINHYQVESIIKTRPPIVLGAAPPKQSEATQQNETYRTALDLSLLSQIMPTLINMPTPTLLEGADWWRESSRYGHAGRESLSEHLVWLIIRHEHNAYSLRDSFPLTRKLIDLASDAPKLLGILFTDTSYPPYLCFLLSSSSTNHLGLIQVYNGLSHSHRPISEKVAYEQIWQDLVWTQALEVYSQSYQDNLDITQLQGTIEQICELLAWFTKHELGYNSRGKSISDTRLPSLKAAINSIKYITRPGLTKHIVEDHSKLFCKVAHTRLTSSREPDGTIPLGEWLTLFWCIEWSTKTENSRDKEDVNLQEINQICEILIESYLTVLNERVRRNCNASDDPIAFDELDWDRLYRAASDEQRTRWIHALEHLQASETSVLPKDQRSLIFAVRMHFRLLLQLHNSASDETSRNKLVDSLLFLIERFGFDSNRLSGALDYLNDNSDYSPIRLWPAFCSTANSFSAANFERFIDILRKRFAPMSSLFTLLERIAPFNHRTLTLNLISERDLEQESPNWIPEAFDILIKAANTGQNKITKEYLSFLKKHAHKTFKNKTDEIAAKIDLKEIFESPSLTDAIKLQQLGRYNIESEDRQVIQEVRSFKAYLIASLNIILDHHKALQMFSEALVKEPSLQNATGLIKTVLLWPHSHKMPASLDSYFEKWLNTFNTVFPLKNKAQLSDSELDCILQLCLKLSRLEDFRDFWSLATTQQRVAFEFAPLRVEYLKKTGRADDAQKYINELRNIHQGLSSSVLDELLNTEEIPHHQKPTLQDNLHQAQTAEISSSQENYRNTWLNIRNLDAFDQSQIFMQPTNSIDGYLIQIIEQVGHELLMRNGNLQRKKPSTPSSAIPLDDEDMINDWLVSLVRQRMNFAGWTVHDQSRIGRSASNKGVGETDGWIEDSQGNLISIIEAFRLGKYIDRSTIRQHLDKISKYNSTGTSPIFIVVYTATENFPILCSEYAQFIQELEYDGFDPGKRIELHKRISKTAKASTAYYEETRFVNETPINIYHHILHLKPPIDPS
ncbi:hypothetical protein [Pseudomonas chlororaphis]|uniref:hypothetical protein n=1 Tax=Pseudomonas chlororaphis TaxID=587753 RepID=UPI000F56CC36|nr:hypothetical protein [Pseudomonas chlororaphis]AZC84684.1 hypothetical protein C4K30_5605 [Pseudomonas chlororaphis subsp. piscium]